MASPSSSTAEKPESTPGQSTPGQSAADTGSDRPEATADAWRQVAVQLGQVRAFAGHFVQAKIDSVKLTIRQFVLFAAVCVIGLVALAAVAVMMVVFLFQGIAGGFAELFGGKLWLGELVTAALFAMVLTAAGSMALGAIRNASRRQTVEKYASRQSQQRIDYGTDVHEQANRA